MWDQINSWNLIIFGVRSSRSFFFIPSYKYSLRASSLPSVFQRYRDSARSTFTRRRKLQIIVSDSPYFTDPETVSVFFELTRQDNFLPDNFWCLFVMDYDVDFFFLFFKYIFNISLLIKGLTFVYLKNSLIILVLSVIIMNFISCGFFFLCCNLFQRKKLLIFWKGWICLFCDGSSAFFLENSFTCKYPKILNSEFYFFLYFADVLLQAIQV